MYKKAFFLIFSLVGFISLFLPFNKVIIIGCALDGGGFTDYYYDPFIKYLVDFFTFQSITFLDVFEFLAFILVIFSLVLTPLLLFYNRKKISLLLIVLTLGLMIISLYNSYDSLVYGYYIIFLQQSVLLVLTILSKNKILHLQKL
ncbi:hypothetical protein BXU11_02020 [Flavobacterium sp. LM5]|uniref:hypothetical protein n=1 Tax=Flavobacterium sp. LM5 TaxID=1938610 RepID=UPI000993E061|nr:hypothetical protein [Flavobacterium sp. LM5]OOV28746.1 hypothetical protein BXU11_02020 [Flavobacterium sp. LM5]